MSKYHQQIKDAFVELADAYYAQPESVTKKLSLFSDLETI
jgi:hypothetical protein